MVFDILDRQKACNPDPTKPFESFDDAFERLSAYQAFDTQLPNTEEAAKYDKAMDAGAQEIVKRMSEVEKKLEQHLHKEAKENKLEEQIALEKLSCQQALQDVKAVREERGRAMQPERLLCLVHGLREESILQRYKEQQATMILED
eukprot:CAMPEP_0184486296 /NCGR_PEP_ID=MMETSP0113_2-20130426/7812_1 /TAXON_ID=91329 /ORGANISM="Norrisiella sphaerica, Strain BC52" /LENGTH=145 /DNA_ID=CAMNT_0026868103 /DNA_START=116 /DNA_END=553 /DNA_ORIENTATION=+